MQQFTLNIPDKEVDFFLKLVQKFNYKSSSNTDVVITKKQMDMVVERRKTAKKTDFISAKESSQKLKNKYGFWATGFLENIN